MKGERSVGNGPPCPVDPRHGRLLQILQNKDGSVVLPWYCPHSECGNGGGRSFTEDQAYNGIDLKESDMASILENTARDIATGKLDLDMGIAAVARATHKTTSQVREQVNEAVAAITAAAEAKAAARETKRAERAVKPVAEKAIKIPREKADHSEPAAFAAVRDELGMTNKEVAAALVDVVGNKPGVAPTLSRMTELMHSKGASSSLLVKFTEALQAWRRDNPKAD